ncbi:hypothetical protein AYO38_00375 [bacterium SCGC AG-212-C10]|nr:hypothetical protein AYO38_00375 [bacterium SCGC AG-212-C10]
MRVKGFDHVSLPTPDVERLIAFYRRLGFPILHEEEWRAGTSRLIGIQVDEHSKINVHTPELWRNPKFTLKGPTAQPGCGDLCFRFDGTIEEAVAYLNEAGAPIEFGPVEQKGGADGGQRQGASVYTRDPDGNLLEFMTYPE